MTQELATTHKNAVSVWENPSEIRKLFAPTLTDTEFDYFMGLSQATGANPFTREIWAVKYGKDNPAQIFHGRDFYRRRAQELEQYRGHTVDAVYQHDTFEVLDGKPRHAYKLGERGRLLGAYCVVYAKNRDIPYFVFAELSEYTTGKSTWKDKPATMIKKVAEAQALRGAFQGVFEGTYSEAEAWEPQDTITVDAVHHESQGDVDEKKLQEAYAAIKPFYGGMHPIAVSRSLKKHLGQHIEKLEDCRDIDLLGKLWKYKNNQIKKKQHGEN